MPDLWPDDFGTIEVVPPITVLREQANWLTDKTQGVLEGRVASGNAGGKLSHRFSVVAPSLDYSYELFSVEHPLEMYPLRMHVPALDEVHECVNHADFVQALKRVLGAQEIKRIVAAIL